MKLTYAGREVIYRGVYKKPVGYGGRKFPGYSIVQYRSSDGPGQTIHVRNDCLFISESK